MGPQSRNFGNLIVIICSIPFSCVAANHNISQMSGKHFIVAGLKSIAGLNVIRNSTGHIIEVGGMAARMLEWQSQYFNFTYSILQVNDTSLDPTADQKGLISYLMTDECQILISVVVTRARIPLMDFSQPTLYVPVSYLIPKAAPSVNIASIANPFDKAVWIALLVSIFLVGFVLYSFRKCVKMNYFVERLQYVRENDQRNLTSYIVCVILSQGAHLHYRSFPFYIVAGVWCMAAFVLVNAYTSTLISYLTLPNEKLMIDSIYDFRNRSDIYLVTDRNLNTDAVLSSADTGFLKLLGDKLRSYSNSRCNTTKECIALVKSGSHVYSSGITSFLYGAIKDDYNLTGECNFFLQQESYLNLQATWAYQKQRDPLRNSLDMGILRMREAGLLDKWTTEAQPNATRCLGKDKKRGIRRLSLDNLSGAFVILIVGMTSSFFVFIGEQVIFRQTRRQRKV